MGAKFESFFGRRQCGGAAGAFTDISRFSKRLIVMYLVDEFKRNHKKDEKHPYFVLRQVCKDFGVLVGEMVSEGLLLPFGPSIDTGFCRDGKWLTTLPYLNEDALQLHAQASWFPKVASYHNEMKHRKVSRATCRKALLLSDVPTNGIKVRGFIDGRPMGKSKLACDTDVELLSDDAATLRAIGWSLGDWSGATKAYAEAKKNASFNFGVDSDALNMYLAKKQLHMAHVHDSYRSSLFPTDYEHAALFGGTFELVFSQGGVEIGRVGFTPSLLGGFECRRKHDIIWQMGLQPSPTMPAAFLGARTKVFLFEFEYDLY